MVVLIQGGVEVWISVDLSWRGSCPRESAYYHGPPRVPSVAPWRDIPDFLRRLSTYHWTLLIRHQMIRPLVKTILLFVRAAV